MCCVDKREKCPLKRGKINDKKYQQEGGPTFRDCYQLIQKVSTHPIEDGENLLRWQIFNVLAGNFDGHAKNLSLIYKEKNQVRLAPFYDLVCTRAIERIDPNLALSIGNEFNPQLISLKHWKRLAHDCNVRYQYLEKIIQETAESLLKNFSETQEAFETDHDAYPALQRIKTVINKQCQRILR